MPKPGEEILIDGQTDEEFVKQALEMKFSEEAVANALLSRRNQRQHLEAAGKGIVQMVMRAAEGKPAHAAPKLLPGKAFGIPERYMGKPPEQIIKAFGTLRTHGIQYLDQMAWGWPGLLIYGGLGVGKTGVGVEFMKLFEERQCSSRFETLWRMVSRVKSTWGENSPLTELEVIDEYVKPNLLVVDEVGVQFGTLAERNILYAVVVNRYNALKPTILTTNCDIDTPAGLEEFFNSVGTRVGDRFQGFAINASKWGTNVRGK